MLTAYNAQKLIQQRDSKCRLRVLGDCASKDVHACIAWGNCLHIRWSNFGVNCAI